MLQFLLKPSEKQARENICGMQVMCLLYIVQLDTGHDSLNYPSPSRMYMSLCLAMLYFCTDKTGKNKNYCILYTSEENI